MKIEAKKQFGQNFLKDESIVHKIVESMPKDDKQIVEIGPGLGDLTSMLLKFERVKAYEVDRDLCPILEQKFRQEIVSDRFSLICTDVLEYWESHSSLNESRYNLVANLPYYISTTIILKAFEDENCDEILVMTQLEVAQKFAADVGNREFSSLGVLTQLIGSAQILFEVPPEAFDPIPKVTSAVLQIKKSNHTVITREFKEFLKTAFSQPRKTLLKNLSSKFDKSAIRDVYIELQIPENFRPHQTSTQQYKKIYEHIG